MARPTSFSEELGQEIAARSAEGKSLKTICESEDMPSLRTVQRWRTLHVSFDELLMRAHLDKADIIFEEALSIADEPVADITQATRNRLRCETRLKVAARLHPAKYSERLGIGGAPGLPPLQPERELDPQEKAKRDLETARRIAFVLARADHYLKQDAPPVATEPLRLPHVDLHGLPVHKPDQTVSEHQAEPATEAADVEEWVDPDADNFFGAQARRARNRVESGLVVEMPASYTGRRPLTGAR